MDIEPRRIHRPEPLIRAEAMLSVTFERQDPVKMREFLQDFGLLHTETIGQSAYFRGYAEAPYVVCVIASSRDAFVGMTLSARNAGDLDTLSRATGAPVEEISAPGGGRRVALTDPDGLRVDLVHGYSLSACLQMPAQTRPMNTPLAKVRVNEVVRSVPAPSPVFRLGHVVLQRPDFDRAAQWYMLHFGILPSDIQCLASGQPALGFFRLDRGALPADHHSIALLVGPAAKLVHVSFETMDLEAVGQGHQHLKSRGWTPFWGIGRHMLGSQIFDYWKDPVGDEWEHYADGDVMNADYPTGYSPLTRGSLWAWGDDLPASMRPDVPLDAIEKIYADGGFGDMNLATVKELIQALDIPPRPWMR